MFLKYANKPHKSGNYFVGGCPICHEGKSWGKKQRAKYFPDENYFYCHNDQQGYCPYQWIEAVTGWSYQEILDDVISYSGKDFLERVELEQTFVATSTPAILPINSIDLTDPLQLQYYHGRHPIIDTALRYIEERRLLTAVNTCGKFYVSLDDPVFRNRLILPYYRGNDIEYYTTRTLVDTDPRPKYFGKFSVDKPIFNINKLDSSLGVYFMFEGPIDSMFCVNAVSITGVHASEYQLRQLSCYDMLMKRIWVLDNQRIDKTAREKTLKLADTGESVFVWPPQLEKYKDFNQLAVAIKQDQIPYQLITENAKSGVALKLSV